MELQLYSIQSEQMVLGSIFMEPDLVKDLKITEHHVSPGKHFNILHTMKDLDAKGIVVDIMSVMERVGNGKIEKLGGIGYLSELAGSVPTTANFEHYQNIILENWQRREAVKIADDIKRKVFEGEATDAIQTGISDLLKVESLEDDKDNGDYKEELLEMYDDLEGGPKGVSGIPSGYSELDRMTAGWQPGDLIIVGARPSVGKTAFALNMASNAAAGKRNPNGDVAAIFSLEMGKKQLLKRMASSEGNINADAIRTGNLTDKDWEKLSMSIASLSDMDLKIFDQPAMTVNQIYAKVRKLKRQFEGRRILVMIDYLQLITGNKEHRGNRQAEISEISRMLKTMARDLDVVVIALSQLSRGVEQRQDKRPMMSDLRESGQIEQDADIIAFLYRDDYYDKESENKNIIEIILAKHRNGSVGTVNLAFVKEYSKFVNLERRFGEG